MNPIHPFESRPPASLRPLPEVLSEGDPVALRRHPLREGFRVLRTRKWWVLGVLLGALVLTLLLIWLMTPVYRGRVLLQITEDHSLQRLSDNDPVASLLNKDMDRFLATQVGILTSRSLAWQIIESLNLKEHPDFRQLKDKNPDLPPHQWKNDLIDLFLKKKLSVLPVKESFLVEISFKSTDAQLACEVPNAIAREYVRLAINRRNDSYALVREWLEGQLKIYSQKVQDSQKRLYDFGQRADFFSLEDKENVIVQKYVELSNLLTKAQSERMGKEALYRQITEKGADAPSITSNPLIIALRQELVAQEAKAASLGKIFLPDHPDWQAEQAKLQEIRGRLQAEVNRLKASVKADYEAAHRAEKLLADAFAQHKRQVANLQAKLVDFQILKRDVQATEKLYQALLSRMGEAAVASTMVPSHVTVIDPADLPSEPYLPRPLLFLGLAGFLGLGFGVGAAFLVESLDDSLKSETDVERYCQLPPLGYIPRSGEGKATYGLPFLMDRLRSLLPLKNWRSAGRGGPILASLNHPDPHMQESFRHLQSTLMFSRPERPPRSLLVTSPHPQEGKTTLTSNMAYFLAAEGSRRVVLLDCDLRCPQLHRFYNLSLSPGLTDYLIGYATKSEIARAISPQLTVIPAGTMAPNPAELLMSKPFSELVAELLATSDHLIIDTPPLLLFADARIIAPLVEGVVLVFRQGYTSREAAMQARRLLTQVQAQVLGAILNHVEKNGLGTQRFYRSYQTPRQDKADGAGS